MNARKTLVASLFLAVAFFLGAGQAQAQYRPTSPYKGFTPTSPSPFAKTPPPTYTWRNGDGQTRTSSLPYYNPNHFLPTWNPTPNQIYRLQRR
jgi:hypothetical protein